MLPTKKKNAFQKTFSFSFQNIADILVANQTMDANMYGVPAGRKKGNQINGSCQPVTSNWLAPRGKSHHLCHRMAIFYVFLTLNCQLFEKMQ
jgi:hypothetical protein